MTQSSFGQSLHPKYPKWLVGSTYLQCIAVLWQLWWEFFLHTDMSVNMLCHIESILFIQSCSFRAWLRLCWAQAKPWALPSCQQGLAWQPGLDSLELGLAHYYVHASECEIGSWVEMSDLWMRCHFVTGKSWFSVVAMFSDWPVCACETWFVRERGRTQCRNKLYHVIILFISWSVSFWILTTWPCHCWCLEHVIWATTCFASDISGDVFLSFLFFSQR